MLGAARVCQPFDGNKQVKQKVTFDRIRKHLEATYKRKFGYGTVVQLCVARNLRRKSAKRYKGVARVTTREQGKDLPCVTILTLIGVLRYTKASSTTSNTPTEPASLI